MFRDRLTQLALRRAHSRIITPVIVETVPGRLRAIAEEISPFAELVDRLPGFLKPPEFAVGPYPMRVIPRFSMVAAILPREIIFRLGENRNVMKVYSDEQVWAFVYPTVPFDGIYEAPHKVVDKIRFTSTYWTKRLIGADVANQKGFRGRDITVAVPDTGVSRTHVQTRRAEFETTMKQYRDENGHGTWCVSCIGGDIAIDEYLSQRSGKRVVCEGMAPESRLIGIKCLGYYIGTGMTSNIIQAVEIALNRGADIISMSLGGASQTRTPEDDPFYPVMEEVVKYSVIPVVAAGNEGPEENTIGSPGAMPQVLTVGAIDPITGEVAEFSSRGPTNWGDIKPDVVSYGVNVDSAAVGMCDNAGDGVPSRYSPLSGTSMATPHVAGLVALMRESMFKIVGKILTVDEIKRMMSELGESKNNATGWGLITWNLWETWLSTQYGVEI